MDAMEIARDITVAIISNPNYKPGSGENEAEIFATVLSELTRALGEGKKVKPGPKSTGKEILTIKDMRSKTAHLKAPVTL